MNNKIARNSRVNLTPYSWSQSAGRWLLLLALLALVVVLAATLGAPVPFSDLWSVEAAKAEVAQRIFWRVGDEWGLRPVRIMAGLLIGASLASSGAALQSVFRNPLAEPYLLGISSGGALGATIGLWLQSHTRAQRLDWPWILAFVGSLCAAAVVYALGARRTSTRSGSFTRGNLLLTGVALSSFLAALMSLILALSDSADLAQQIVFWTLGTLTRATPEQNVLLFLVLLAGLVLLLFSARDLNALRAGDEEASTLGVHVGTLHLRLIVAASLMSAVAVASSGLIGFVGLLAPHLVRRLWGSDARVLLPAAALSGAGLLVGCDAVARSVVSPAELPVGVVTALLGVPLFLVLAQKTSL